MIQLAEILTDSWTANQILAEYYYVRILDFPIGKKITQLITNMPKTEKLCWRRRKSSTLVALSWNLLTD